MALWWALIEAINSVPSPSGRLRSSRTASWPSSRAQGRALYGSGDLRQSWEVADDRPGVVCLYEADSRAQLQGLLDTYLMVQRGYADVLVVALKPDSAYVEIG